MARVKLKDVVMRVKDKADKDNTELEFYVGGEHIDGNEICVTKKGIIQGSTIGPAFHMAFKAGDVLLMSRNPHLRKASMVDFDGICSDVSYVCRTKDENVLLQSYLPFLLQSDDFWRFAEENKKGGLPFFLNWSDFERYEFELPSIEKQRELSDLLWSMQRTKQAYQELLAKTDELVKSQFIELFGGKGYSVKTLAEVCSKITDGTHKTPNYQESGVVFISAKDISSGTLDLSQVKYITEAEYTEIQKRCQTEYGDIILSKSGTLGVPAVIDTTIPLGIFESLAILKYDRTILDARFLCEQLRSTPVQEQIKRGIKGISVKHLHLNVIKALEVIIPPLDVQKEFSAIWEQTDKSKFTFQIAIYRDVW